MSIVDSSIVGFEVHVCEPSRQVDWSQASKQMLCKPSADEKATLYAGTAGHTGNGVQEGSSRMLDAGRRYM